MDICKKTITLEGVKFYSTDKNGRQIARAYLYLMSNDLHQQPFGLMEDVFVEDSLRGQGIGSALVQQIIAEAQSRGCYKLICTSRHEKPQVHQLYERLGFKNHGREFRIDF